MRHHGIRYPDPGLRPIFLEELLSVKKTCKTPDDYTKLLLGILQ